MGTAKVVIRRDHTFTANGREYRIVGGRTPDETAQYGYEIEDIETGTREDGYYTIQDIRDHVAQCVASGDPIVEL